MNALWVVVLVLFVYKIVLLAIGFAYRNKGGDDAGFFLGDRSLGPWFTALSSAAGSSSAWTLLGVSGFAYTHGLSAVWIFPGSVGAFFINWYLVGPKLREAAVKEQALTLTDFLAGREAGDWNKACRYAASLIVLCSLLVYVASQYQGAGKLFEATFAMDPVLSIVVSALIIWLYSLTGGFLAVSATDTLQGLVMAACALLLPMVALFAVGGPLALAEGIAAVPDTAFRSFTRDMELMAAVGFIGSLVGISLGGPGQPHVVNRFMAARDEQSIRIGRRIALTWACLVFAGMILLGWCGRVLGSRLADNETILFQLASDLLPPVLAGIVLAAVLSATMSTADSQLLVAASSVTHDLPGNRRTKHAPRIALTLVSVAAVLLAVFGDRAIFSKVLFAWSALGAAFGPLLLVRLHRGRVQPQYAFAAMVLGFSLGVVFYLLPGTKGTVIERVLPFVCALFIAFAGAKKNEAHSS